MRTMTKLGTVLVFIGVMASSCSVEYKTRHRRHRVIEVGMNEQKLQKSQVSYPTGQNASIENPVAVK